MSLEAYSMSERHDYNVYNMTVKLAPFVACCAAIVFTCAKLFLHLYEDTSIAELVIFDTICLFYIAIAAWFKKQSITSGGKPSKKLIIVMRYVLCALIILQWNLITYFFPTRDFWGYAALFVILTAFFFDQKFVLIESIGLILSIAISWHILPDKLLPLNDIHFKENLVLRSVSIIITLFCVFYLSRTSEKFKDYVDKQHKQLIKQNQDLLLLNNDTISFTAKLVEKRDGITGAHIKNIEEYVRIITSNLITLFPEYNLNYNDVMMYAKASILHDVGKIGVPDSILLKKTSLTEEEYEIIKKHTYIGAELINELPSGMEKEFIACCKDVCLYHHERYDGKGYPEGLKGNEIPLSAQIVGIADSFDALVNERPYKKAYSFEDAVNMINAGECGAFGETILKAFNESANELLSATTQN